MVDVKRLGLKNYVLCVHLRLRLHSVMVNLGERRFQWNNVKNLKAEIAKSKQRMTDALDTALDGM